MQPRLALATHLSFDRELLNEMSAGVRMFYKGLFAYGIDNVVFNVTKDRVWIREAAVNDYAGVRSPDPLWVMRNMFDGQMPAAEMMKTKYTVAGNQEQAVRDLEIDPALFTPKDQMRKWIREWPQDAKPEDLMPQPAGGPQAPKK